MDLAINTPINYTPGQFATANGLPSDTYGFASVTAQRPAPPGTTISYASFAGTPTAAGTYVIRLERYDDYGTPVNSDVTVIVFDPTPSPIGEATGPTVTIGRPIDLQADAVAVELGLSNTVGEVYQFDTSRSTVPAGVTLELNRAHGTPTEAGAYSLLLFYASSGTSYQETNYRFQVDAVVDPEPEPEPETPISPTGKAVAAFLAHAGDTALEALATQHSTVITAMAYAYTRGIGFTLGTPNPAIESVIIMATARLVANPEQIDITVGSTRVGRGFQGWNLSETLVLNLYRRRAG